MNYVTKQMRTSIPEPGENCGRCHTLLLALSALRGRSVSQPEVYGVRRMKRPSPPR
jgi:hypothetical protein